MSEVVTQPFGEGDHHLTQRRLRQDVIHQMRRGLHHAFSVAGRANAAALAGKSDEKVVAAILAAGTGEPMGENAAMQKVAQVAFDVEGNTFSFGIVFAMPGQPAFHLLLHCLVRSGVFGAAALVGAALGRAGRYFALRETGGGHACWDRERRPGLPCASLSAG